MYRCNFCYKTFKANKPSRVRVDTGRQTLHFCASQCFTEYAKQDERFKTAVSRFHEPLYPPHRELWRR